MKRQAQTTNNPHPNDVVYRSLNVVSSSPAVSLQQNFFSSESKSTTIQFEESSFKKMPIPFAQYTRSLETSVEFTSKEEAMKLFKRLTDELQNSKAVIGFEKVNDGEYEIRAFAPDGAEHVKFQIMCYESNEEPHLYLIEANRLSGCAYFFHSLLQEIIKGDNKCEFNKNRLFRAPTIPDDMIKNPIEIMQQQQELHLVLNKASCSDDAQQWRDGCCTLLSLCCQDKTLFKKFKQCDDWEPTVRAIQKETNDPVIKHVGERLVQLE